MANGLKKWEFTLISQAINSVSECIITHVRPAEDYVTQQITVRVSGSDNMIYIRGFRTDQVNPSKDFDRIEMVEVTTGYSDGDMPNDPDYCIIHAKVKAAIMRLGYDVVNSLDPYF